jgi:hypothetical protein
MAVIIKRFRVRHNGVVYGPGQPGGTILTGLSKEEEARLIAGSNGTIEKYVPFVIDEKPIEQINEVSEADKPEKDTYSTPEDAGLPEINPTELIKPATGKKK